MLCLSLANKEHSQADLVTVQNLLLGRLALFQCCWQRAADHSVVHVPKQAAPQALATVTPCTVSSWGNVGVTAIKAEAAARPQVRHCLGHLPCQTAAVHKGCCRSLQLRPFPCIRGQGI